MRLDMLKSAFLLTGFIEAIGAMQSPPITTARSIPLQQAAAQELSTDPPSSSPSPSPPTPYANPNRRQLEMILELRRKQNLPVSKALAIARAKLSETPVKDTKSPVDTKLSQKKVDNQKPEGILRALEQILGKESPDISDCLEAKLLRHLQPKLEEPSEKKARKCPSQTMDQDILNQWSAIQSEEAKYFSDLAEVMEAIRKSLERRAHLADLRAKVIPNIYSKLIPGAPQPKKDKPEVSISVSSKPSPSVREVLSPKYIQVNSAPSKPDNNMAASGKKENSYSIYLVAN